MEDQIEKGKNYTEEMLEKYRVEAGGQIKRSVVKDTSDRKESEKKLRV